MHAGIQPPGKTPTMGKHPPGQTPLWVDTPCAVYAGIWSTRGQYVSHWNAFLLLDRLELLKGVGGTLAERFGKRPDRSDN